MSGGRPDRPARSRAVDADAASRAAEPAHMAPADSPLLRLQRQVGNRGVGALLRQAAAAAPQGVDESVEAGIESARGTGTSLQDPVRRQMETAMGADFSRVRVHADRDADKLGRAMGARAFTTGADVFFREGEYNPGTSAGRELLAHELAHVVQNGAGVRAKMSVSEPGDDAEREADAVAQAVMRAEQAGAEPALMPSPGGGDASRVFGFWQEVGEAVGGVLGIPVPLAPEPFKGDVGSAPPVQTVKASANSYYKIVYDGGVAGPSEWWPHSATQEPLTKSVPVERGSSGTISILFTTWWHTEGGAYKDGTTEATISAHFTCGDDGAIVVEPAVQAIPSGGGSIVTPIATGGVVGPSLTATGGVDHTMSSTQTGTSSQDRSSGQSNSGGMERGGSIKVGGDVKVAEGEGELSGKSTYSQGNERKSGEQRSTSVSLQQSGAEHLAFTRNVGLVAKPAKPLASGSIESFRTNHAELPANGLNTLVRWWTALDPDLKNGVRMGSIGMRFSGHADDTGDAKHNLDLSGRRAHAVEHLFQTVVGKAVVTDIEQLGSAMAEGEKKSNERERRVDFELYRIKK